MTDRIAKKPYQQPILSIFGAFSKLTAGGSGLQTETGANMNPNRRP
ncbi:hypothetical protein [uncultured Erythrobacter sp.]|nr:hypothetical protein [uncultured Erythrobacter sp.]